MRLRRNWRERRHRRHPRGRAIEHGRHLVRGREIGARAGRQPLGQRASGVELPVSQGAFLLLETIEHRQYFGGVLKTLRRILLEAAQHHVLKRGRYVGEELRGRRRRGLHVMDHDQEIAFLLERHSARQRFEQDDPERVQVRAVVDDLAAHLFRRHVVHRSNHRPRHGELLPPLDLGNAEVHHLGDSFRRQHDVGGLEVAVHHAHPVRCREPLQNLPRKEHDDVGGKRADLPNDLRQRSPFDVLHDHAVRIAVGFEFVQRDYVRVIQPRLDLRLRLEALELVGARVERRVQDLDRHAAPEMRVSRLVDGAHASMAELRHDPMVSDGLSDHLLHLPPPAPRVVDARASPAVVSDLIPK